MRDIKFRAWVKESWSSQLQKWIKEKLFYCVFLMKGHIRIPDSSLSSANFDECEIMQCTGLKDKNGKEIYENNVLRMYIKSTVNGNNITVIDTVKITFESGAFWYKGKFYTGCDWNFYNAEDIEVIGNIYENPELLKGVKI